MTDANEMCDTIMRELSNVAISDTDESMEEQESLLLHEEEDLDDVPPFLLSYFETSRSKAAVCEKLILEELEDFSASHHTEDMMKLPIDLDKDMMKLNEQVTCDTENEENNTSSDTRLLPAPTETEALFTHNVSVCPNNEDEAGTHEYMESEQRLAFEVRTLEIALNEEERKKSREYEAEREKRRCEEMKKEEQKRQIERDFQKELKKIMEAERLHQKELELMQKRAQEKLEQEFLLQQELIRNLQRRVEEERRTREEEQKRMKEVEDKRKREEEKIKIEAERKRMEEETRRKKEEERKIEDMKLKKEEEEKRKMEREEKRKRDEERNKTELEKKKLEDEMRMMKEEEERKKKEEVERIKREEEEEIKKTEEAKKKMEKEEIEMEEEISLRKEEEGKKREEENMRIEEEGRITKEIEERKTQTEMRKKKEEEEADDRKKMYEDLRKMDEREHGNEELERKKKEEARKREKERKKMEEEKKEVVRIKMEEKKEVKEAKEVVRIKMEEVKEVVRIKIEEKKEVKEVVIKKMEEKKEVKEVVRKKEEENRKVKEELRPIEEDEKRKKDNERKTKEEEQRRRQKEEMRRQRDEEWTSSSPGPLHSESTICPTSTETKIISQTSVDKTVDCERSSTASAVSPECLPEHTEQKRLAWMKDCIPWSKLSLQNRRKQKGSVQRRRGPRRAAEAVGLPPLCPDSLLQSAGWKSLQEVTTVTLEDLPGCSLSTLAQCIQLRSLTLRRCGLKSLDGINQLPQLCYIDVQENDILFVNCENMTSLRVLQLSHNKLTSIHGLTGAENVDVLDLSHNSITRIAGLESMRRLQRLSVDHNQLISTKGLRDVYTLLHLSCSHNHLASVEGLENSALLNTLDLRANSLTEPPSLNNQVLLRELHLDDNSISSLEALSACWLPLMQHLSVAHNRITQLPSMSESVSLANLDLGFNCMSELQNVCESLEGCQLLREVHLTGNPLQQESGWRSTLQRAVPGLRAIDDQETDSFLSPPAVQRVSFLLFCQAQLQQTHDLQQQHSRERSDAWSSLEAVKTSCRHFTEALRLAEDQRFAHEYGDTTVADKHRAAGPTTLEETLVMDRTNVDERTERPEIRESNGKVPPVIPNRDNIGRSSRTSEEKSSAKSRHDTFNTVTMGPKTGPAVSKANSGTVRSLATKGKTISSNLEVAPASNHQDQDLQNTAAVVIQQLWRKYRQKCGNISSPSTAEEGGGRGGDGKPESGPSYTNGSQDYAATVIQAFWRGFALRRRLASALAAVTCLDTGEDDTFEEVDVDEFVFDEAALEKHWTLPLSEDSPPGRYPESEQPLSLKPPGPFSEPSQYMLPPPLVWRSKQAWVAGEQVDSASPVSSIRSKSPPSTSVVSGLSERSEKILEEWGFTHSHTALLMLKRAQRMKSKQQHKKHKDPSVRLALFRNCSYQLDPVEARNRRAQPNRNYIKVHEAELDLQQPEKTARVKQEPAQQWLHTQAAVSDRDSESVHFLPEISSDILNGGRVQLVADPGYTERPHHASGLWASNSLSAQPCKEDNYPRRNSLGHARKEVPSPKRVASAPSKRERISFRDNPVQLSGGWGGGKRRDKV